MATEQVSQNNAISFAQHAAASDLFKSLFRDGMALVEETASYLDGSGRGDAGGLSRGAALAYASESMRLTTRLMQMASWLLLQRAVNEGEMSVAEAAKDKKRTSFAAPGPVSEAVHLPEALQDLIDRSLRLQERLVHLDALIEEPTLAQAAPSPIADQISRLRDAFCR